MAVAWSGSTCCANAWSIQASKVPCRAKNLWAVKLPAGPLYLAHAEHGYAALNAPLKLIALDAEDLAVISAHVQQARVQASDIVWRQAERRLVIGLDRPDWEETFGGAPSPRRLIAALRFERVLACKSRNIDAKPETMLELVGIGFCPGEAPGGSALLMFSDGGALRLDVECLECELTDLGPDDLGTGEAEAAQ